MTGANISVYLGSLNHSKLELPFTNEIPAWFTITFASINGGGFCLNTLSLWLLATRKFVYRCKVNAFIVSLCLSDFLVALSSFYFLATITSNELSPFSKRVATIVFGFALETSLMSLWCLSYERLTAIRKPFQYAEILTTARVIGILVIGWVFCISLLAMQFAFGFIYRHERYVYINWIVFSTLSIVSITFLALVYMYLISEIRRHSSHIRSCSISRRHDDFLTDVSSSDQITEVTFATTSSDDSKLSSPDLDLANRHHNFKQRQDSVDLLRVALCNKRDNKRSSFEKRRLSAREQLIKKERRSVFFCLCVVFSFAATWLPVTVFFTRCLIAHTCEHDDNLLFICTCLVSANALLDPILYFIIKREFRNFFFGKLCRYRLRRKSDENPRAR